MGLVFDPAIGVAFAAALITFRSIRRDRPKSIEDLLRGRIGRLANLPLVTLLTPPGSGVPVERRIGVTISRILALATGLAQIALALHMGKSIGESAEQGVIVGITVGLAAGFLTVSPRPTPREIQFDARRGLGIVIRHLLISLVAGLGIGVAAGALLRSSVAVVLAVSIWGAIALIDSLNVWLDVSTDVTTANSPQSTCRADRFAATCRAGAIGLTIAAAIFAVSVLAHGWRNEPAAIGLPLLFGAIWAIADPYVGIGASAWGRYMSTMAWLSLRGDLPWRFMTFLDDAHQRDVLRRAGAVHQFRHIHLQERLARL